MDLYSAATNHLGEVPTNVVRDTSSALHNYHPTHSLPDLDDEEPEFDNKVRFWQANHSKNDPAKPAAIPTAGLWQEPPPDYTAPKIDIEPDFTSEVDMSYWMFESGGDEI